MMDSVCIMVIRSWPYVLVIIKLIRNKMLPVIPREQSKICIRRDLKHREPEQNHQPIGNRPYRHPRLRCRTRLTHIRHIFRLGFGHRIFSLAQSATISQTSAMP